MAVFKDELAASKEHIAPVGPNTIEATPSVFRYLQSKKPKVIQTEPVNGPEPLIDTRSTAQKVGNWFEGEAKGLYEGVKQTIVSAKDFAQTTGSYLKLNNESSLQDRQTKRIAEEVKTASQLPTLAQRKEALAKIGSPTKYIDEGAIDQITKEYTKLGITDADNQATKFRKSIGEGLNVAFAATALVDPLQAGLKAISGDAVSGALVNTVVREGAESSIAKTVGESMINDAGSAVRTEIRTATQQGTKVLTESAATKYATKVVNAGITNGIVGAVNEWSTGNNAQTKEEKQSYLRAIGMGFLTGAVIESVTAAPSFIGETKSGNRILEQVNKQLGTSYSGPMGAELGNTIQDIQKTYGAVIRTTKLQELSSYAENQFNDLKQANINKNTERTAVKTQVKSRKALESIIGNTPVVGSYDEAAANMKKTYGVNINPAKPGEEIVSGVTKTGDGYTLNFKQGDFHDYMRQVGQVVPKILQDKGVSLSFLKNELSEIPDSGVKELDTPQAKIQTVISGINSDNAELFRSKYPTVSSAFDAVHGVVKKITPTDAAQAFVRDNIPDYYHDIDHTIAKESSKVITDPVTGNLKQVFDQEKNQKLWLDVQDLVMRGKSRGDVVKSLQKTIEKSDYVTALRETAQSKDANLKGPQDAGKGSRTKQFTYQDVNQARMLFEKADHAASAIKTLDGKIAFWERHLDTFNINKPEFESRFENPNPTFKESPLGTAGEIPSGEGRPSDQEKIAVSKPDTNLEKTEETVPETKKIVENVENQFKGSDGYHPEKSLEEIQKAASFVHDNYDDAVKVIMGGDVPEGFANEETARQYIRAAVKDAALAKEDYATVNMAASEHNIAGSKAGAALQSTKWISDNSPSGMVQKAFDALKSFTKDKVMDVESGIRDLKKEVALDNLTTEEAHGLIDTLTCN